MSELTIVSHGRGIEDVTRDIKIQTGQFLRAAIEIGRLLFEAKELVGQGNWGKYIEEELPFSQSWANNYMKLYKEYGSEQLSIFDSQAFENLRPTQALELLALPAEDRAAFVEANDVEAMSTRDLHKRIQEELDRERAAHQVTSEMLEAMRRDGQAKDDLLAEAQKRLTDAQKKEADTQAKLASAESRAKAAEDKAKKSKEELDKAKKNPQVPDAVMKELQAGIQAEADKKAAEAAKKELDKLNEQLRQAEEARTAAEQALMAARKQSQLSDPDAAVFKAIFTQVQEDFNRLNGILIKIDAKDPALGQKLHSAVNALLDKLKQEAGN